MHYIFDEDISTQTVNDLIAILEPHEEITLYFSTNGGETPAMRCLIDFLNNKKVKVILTSWLISAGTLLLTEFDGELIISDELDFIMFHMYDRESYSLRKGKISDSVLTKQDLEGNKIFAEKLKQKGYLNDKQIKQFLQGKDIVLYKDTFKKWKQ